MWLYGKVTTSRLHTDVLDIAECLCNEGFLSTLDPDQWGFTLTNRVKCSRNIFQANGGQSRSMSSNIKQDRRWKNITFSNTVSTTALEASTQVLKYKFLMEYLKLSAKIHVKMIWDSLWDQGSMDMSNNTKQDRSESSYHFLRSCLNTNMEWITQILKHNILQGTCNSLRCDAYINMIWDSLWAHWVFTYS